LNKEHKYFGMCSFMVLFHSSLVYCWSLQCWNIVKFKRQLWQISCCLWQFIYFTHVSFHLYQLHVHLFAHTSCIKYLAVVENID